MCWLDTDWWSRFGGREKSLAEQAKAGVNEARTEGESLLQAGKEKSQEALNTGKGFVKETKDRMSWGGSRRLD